MTKSIPNYICVKCGRGFSQKSAGKRHILNVEGGMSELVTEADYRVRILTGTIPLPVSPTIHIGGARPNKKRDLNKKLSDIAYERYHGGFFWRLGEIVAESLSKSEIATWVIQINEVTEHIAKLREKEESEEERKIASGLIKSSSSLKLE